MLQIRGHTSAPRAEAYASATDALNACGVVLDGMYEYSNRMTTYVFEIAQEEVANLCDRLLRAKFVLDGDGEPAQKALAVQTDDEGFIRATLQLTFSSEDGNLRNPNPDLG